MTQRTGPSAAECADRPFAELAVGTRAERRCLVGPEAHGALVDVFGDRSPIHVDEDHALRSGFAGRVVHGAVLNCFLSEFVGMALPGARALLQAVDLRYLRPVYLGDELVLEGEVSQRVETQRVVVLSVTFRKAPSGEVVARGRAQVGVRE